MASLYRLRYRNIDLFVLVDASLVDGQPVPLAVS